MICILYVCNVLPVDKRSLRIHHIELVVKPCPRLKDGSRVGQTAHGSGHLTQVAAGAPRRWLVVDSNLVVNASL